MVPAVGRRRQVAICRASMTSSERTWSAANTASMRYLGCPLDDTGPATWPQAWDARPPGSVRWLGRIHLADPRQHRAGDS
jgi:hypothetical protein